MPAITRVLRGEHDIPLLATGGGEKWFRRSTQVHVRSEIDHQESISVFLAEHPKDKCVISQHRTIERAPLLPADDRILAS
jgi:hypothetical protein